LIIVNNYPNEYTRVFVTDTQSFGSRQGNRNSISGDFHRCSSEI